jgi:cephalosporin hydroxylase
LNPIELFRERNRSLIAQAASSETLRLLSRDWLLLANRFEYSYHFEWLSRPIIQYPQDIVAVQELIWQTRPDLVIETGIAHGGSLILSASMLALLDYCDAARDGRTIDPGRPGRRVIGIDIDIRPHNRAAIESHPLAASIELIHGSSIVPLTVARVQREARSARRVMVLLDSNHTADHVFAELMAYAPLVSEGSSCVVFDTLVEFMSEEACASRSWKPGNSPMTAVDRFLAALSAEPISAADGRRLVFRVDEDIDNRLLISVAPRGYLSRVSAS